MPKQDEIRAKLEAAFAPRVLEVINESHRHAGHAGDDGSGESHFRVKIEADAFGGQSRVARHRAVHAALGADLLSEIHALALEVSD
ncbi:BolA family transcriptional regulator [Maritimibacter sp. DP1N21-5]|uniref:BolA family protein n=1 Tax=Maritimibacter sp. DP1N21-5 TaxID=2836867 RepID=UPI001C45D692|nr:BolA family protein [Maritimibacter sp. DP1N21-5]MBV7409392.1 BolA family transcriptional regulator [Maritimibacter sp. DP1N21-5]